MVVDLYKYWPPPESVLGGPVVPLAKEVLSSPVATVATGLTENPPVSENLADRDTENNSNINWLNGSYSGADIKVVAHLYGQVDRDRELDKLKKQLEFHNAMQEFCVKLLGAVVTNIPPPNLEVVFSPTYDLAMEALKSILIPNNGNQYPSTSGKDLAYNEIISKVRRDWIGYWGSKNFIDRKMYSNRLVRYCESERELHEALSKSITDQIANIQLLIDNSSTTLTLGTLQTISVQTHREKFAVLALGKSQAASYTRGPRTIAGSMIFTLFEEHPFKKLLRALDTAGLYGETFYDFRMNTLIPDQMPPIDLTVIFANEYGSMSKLGIYGVEFVNDGLTLSIEDIFSEEVFNFVARDIDIMTHVGLRKLSEIEKTIHTLEGGTIDGTSLYFSGQREYDEYIKRLDSRLRYVGR